MRYSGVVSYFIRGQCGPDLQTLTFHCAVFSFDGAHLPQTTVTYSSDLDSQRQPEVP